MAKIEFTCTEQKVKELTGFCKSYADPEKNPYKAELLHDDDFNIVSGMNFILSYVTDLFIENLDDFFDDDAKEIKEIKQAIAKKAIEEFADFGYAQLEDYITAALESDEYDSDFAEEE